MGGKKKRRSELIAILEEPSCIRNETKSLKQHEKEEETFPLIPTNFEKAAVRRPTAKSRIR